MGHAGEAGIWSLPVLIEWAHLLAMSLWVGCVGVSGWIVLPALRRDSGPALPCYAGHMSGWATAALTLVIASGVFNTGRVLDSAANLVDTGYGNLLLAKIVLVLVAMGLGGANRFIGMPALRREPREGALRQFILILKIESVVLAMIVLLAAVLTNASPHG